MADATSTEGEGKMLRRVALLALVAAAAGVPAALAAPPPEPQPPAPMTGETFTGGEEHVAMPRCEGNTINFSISGAVAVGPYPGLVLEDGTIKLGAPHPTIPNLFVVDEFHASFKVSQERQISDFVVEFVDVVTGTKDFVRQPTDTGFAFAFCEKHPTGNILGSGFRIGVGDSTVQAHYEAFIHTDVGTFRDEGTTTMQMRWCRRGFVHAPPSQCADPTGAQTRLPTIFEESFFSTLEQTIPIVTPPGNSPTLQNGKGCGDENHLHERVAECR